MNRRDLLLLAAGAAAGRPFGAAAQPSPPVIGFLFIGNAARSAVWTGPWHKAMADLGFVEGRNLAVDVRWAEGDPTRLPGFAADLVARRVAVIVTTTEQAAMAAKQATATIPIVFNYIDDPVGKGLVASIRRPGGNITGIGNPEEGAMESKRLQLLQEIMPAVSRVGHLVAEQDLAMRRTAIDAVATAGRKLGIEVVLLTVGKVEDIDPTFAGATQRGLRAVLVGAPSTFLYAQQERILESAAHHRMPLVSGHLGFAASGGLLQYNVLDEEVPRLTADYVVRILKSQSPAELPIQQPTKFALALNLKTARALGLTFPPGMIGIADQVIE